MGYASDNVATTEGNVDDGHSSALYDAQFKPSSTNLPPLGSITSLVSGVIKPATLDTSTWNTAVTVAPAPVPNVNIQPYTPPTTTVVGVSPYGTGSVTGLISQVTPSPIPVPTTIQDTTVPIPTGTISVPAATNNATTLQQQSSAAAAAGNSSLAAALAAQAASWQNMANSLATGSVVSPLSADPEVSTDTSSPIAKAGLLGDIKPSYLAIAALAAFFLFGKK
jgi:hypothetical protein